MRTAGIPWERQFPPVAAVTSQELAILDAQLMRNLNAPLTSSVGRLFDAAASLAGVCQRVTYEAQAACEFEAAADPEETGAYELACGEGILDPIPALGELAADVVSRVPIPVISSRFHNGLARAVVATCLRLRDESGLTRVALSGGSWQNRFLLRRTVDGLKQAGVRVLLHRRVPPNDGGLALGQAVVVAVSGDGTAGENDPGERTKSVSTRGR
jgi:hydrogenase maturation protein HypF